MDLSDDDTAEEYLNLVSQVVTMQEDVDSDSESEIDDDLQRNKWGGSPREGKARNKDRGFNEAYARLVRDLSPHATKQTSKDDFACLDLFLI